MSSRKELRHAHADQRFTDIVTELKKYGSHRIRWDLNRRSELLEKKLRDANYSLTQCTESCDHVCKRTTGQRPPCYRQYLAVEQYPGSLLERTYEEYRCFHYCSITDPSCSKGEWLQIDMKEFESYAEKPQRSRKKMRHELAEQRFANIVSQLEENNTCEIRWELKDRSELLKQKLRNDGYSLTEYYYVCDHQCTSKQRRRPECHKQVDTVIQFPGSLLEETRKEYRCVHICDSVSCSKGMWLRIDKVVS